jgi:hypothetical protein
MRPFVFLGESMKSVSELLVGTKKQRAFNSIGLSSESTIDPAAELDGALISALKRGWQIAPVLAKSKYFPRTALAGVPTNDPLTIRQWAAELSDQACNWAVETGVRSNLLILGFNYELGHDAFSDLCGDDRSWCTSLQFTDSNERFICFQYSGQRIRAIGSEFPGVRVLRGGCTLIPPSVMSDGTETSYLNTNAMIRDVPDWLFSGFTEDRSALRSRNTIMDLPATG